MQKQEFDRLINHFLTANGCDMEAFKQHFRGVKDTWLRCKAMQ
jgi:hypothetical protein